MSEPDWRQIDNLIEAELRHLRGEGPPPDLSQIDSDEWTGAALLLEVVDALACSLPASPAFEDDPVAWRLGLSSDAR